MTERYDTLVGRLLADGYIQESRRYRLICRLDAAGRREQTIRLEAGDWWEWLLRTGRSTQCVVPPENGGCDECRTWGEHHAKWCSKRWTV